MLIIWEFTLTQKCLESKSSSTTRARPAQIKIVIIICFYLLMAIYTVSVSVATLNEIDPFLTEATNYYLCEASGVSKTGNCSRNGFNQFDSVSKVFAYIIMGVYPLIFLVYIVQLNVCVSKIKRSLNKHPLF